LVAGRRTVNLVVSWGGGGGGGQVLAERYCQKLANLAPPSRLPPSIWRLSDRVFSYVPPGGSAEEKTSLFN
jgi:hypothetical protein